MIKKYWIYAFFLFAVALFALKRLKTQQQTASITVKTFHTGIGWGYDVYRDDVLYIHQEYMPSVAGRKGFTTEAQAKKIAALVVEKMKRTDFPVITLQDLEANKN